MRRAIDFVLATLGLIVVAPLLVGLALWIRLDSPGSPFYSQTRIGRNGRPFRLHKLRSMRPVSGLESGLTRGNDDPRITRVGRWLRRTKLDELPQLWNVVRGDMALVGPRPEVPEFVARYTQEQREVLRARPGLTDPASLAAFDEGAELARVKDPEAHYLEVIMPQKVADQIDYLNNRTLASDAALIARTVLRIFRKS
jgi:lipopolysaccharide/colanic/teichoic acid biosynthesis glycosyltransferase